MSTKLSVFFVIFIMHGSHWLERNQRIEAFLFGYLIYNETDKTKFRDFEERKKRDCTKYTLYIYIL